MRLIQTFLPALRKAPGQGARIVQISSIAGLISGPGWAVNLWVGEVLEKSPQPTRDGYREVSLMAAPLDCRGAPLLTRAGTLRAQHHKRLVSKLYLHLGVRLLRN